MCDRISFLATTDGPLQLRFPPGLVSHSAARAGWNMPRDGAEGEWTGDDPASLVIRHEDPQVRATVRAMILDRYPTRSALIEDIGETRGPDGFRVPYQHGRPVPPADGVWRMDMEIHADDPEDYRWLTSVTGNLYVCEGARISAPALKQTGNLYVCEGARISAPKLRRRP